MKKKEWISYFEAINNRKPTKEEIDLAVTQGEYKATLFDNFLSYIGKKLSNKIIKLCLILIAIIVILIILFPVIKKKYHQSRQNEYTKIYQKVIDRYQDAIKDEKSKGVSPLILSQPSRNPAYALSDSDDDGMEELYISFDDFADKYESIAVYEISGNNVKEIKLSDTNTSQRELSELDWTWFDVDNLLTMKVEDIYSQDLSTITGTWITNDERQDEIVFDDDGPYTINGRLIRETRTSKVDIGGLEHTFNLTPAGFVISAPKSGYISSSHIEFEDGTRSFNLAFDFIPKGIEHGDSNKNYDRIYFHGEDSYLYRETDINSGDTKEIESISEETSKNSTTVSRSNQMNLEELSEGNLSSIVGMWKNNYGNTFEIEESGYLYLGDSLGYPLQDITVSSDGSATGFMNRNLTAGMTPNTTDYVTFIPAGISISGGENADIAKDRIGLSGTIAGYNDPQVYYRVEE